jgi:pimeloyl-ACP methyl ester carboxylesterase
LAIAVRRPCCRPCSPLDGLHRARLSGFQHRVVWGELLLQWTPWLGDLGQAAFYRQIAQADQLHTDEVQDQYGEIAIPTLVCWGQDDTWIPVAKGRELAARIPAARLEPIVGAGHLVQEDAPAELTAALIAFLQHTR